MKTEILQSSLVSPILFLIYISGLFSQVETRVPQISYLLFIDDLGFLVEGYFVFKIKKLLKITRKIALNWTANYTVTYNNSKTKAILFLKA